MCRKFSWAGHLGYDLPLGLGVSQERERAHGEFQRALDQNIEHVPLLIHRPPELLAFPMDIEEYFVQVPLVAKPGLPTSELIGI
jgi:hypothetical protein